MPVFNFYPTLIFTLLHESIQDVFRGVLIINRYRCRRKNLNLDVKVLLEKRLQVTGSLAVYFLYKVMEYILW